MCAVAVCAAACSGRREQRPCDTPTSPSCSLSIMQPSDDGVRPGRRGWSRDRQRPVPVARGRPRAAPRSYHQPGRHRDRQRHGDFRRRRANTGAIASASLTIGGHHRQPHAARTQAPGTAGTLTAPTPGRRWAERRRGSRPSDARDEQRRGDGHRRHVTYRFEVSDHEHVPGGRCQDLYAGRCRAGQRHDELGRQPRPWRDVLWYWHARATNGSIDDGVLGTETSPPAIAVHASRCRLASASASSAAGTGTCTVTPTTRVRGRREQRAFITVTAGVPERATARQLERRGEVGPARRGHGHGRRTDVHGQSGAGSAGGLVSSSAFQLLIPPRSGARRPSAGFRIATARRPRARCNRRRSRSARAVASDAWTSRTPTITVKVITGSAPTLAITDAAALRPHRRRCRAAALGDAHGHRQPGGDGHRDIRQRH